MDNDAIQRREKVFEQLRQVDQEYKDAQEALEIASELRQEKRTQQRYLSTLTNIMIRNDCCPLEAKLRFGDELDSIVSPHHNGYGSKSVSSGNASSSNFYGTLDDDCDDEQCIETGSYPSYSKKYINRLRKALAKTLKKTAIRLSKGI